MFQNDKENAEKMYQTICVHLHNMNLIDETYAMPEFDAMRSQFQRAMYELASVTSGNTENALALQLEQPLDAASITLSRYSREFDEIHFIARGGFGSVYKARNKLDGIEYAVKKVNIKYRTMKRLFKHVEEVKTFASLNHTNIVPYKTAWLEPKFDVAPKATSVPTGTTIPVQKQRNAMKPLADTFQTDASCSSSSSGSSSSSSSSNDDGSYLETGSSDSEDDTNLDHKFSRRFTKDDSSEFIKFEGSNDGDDGDDDDDEIDGANMSQPKPFKMEPARCKRALCKVNNNISVEKTPPQKVSWATLYIQMAFRPLTLRTWLDQRNKSLHFDEFYKDFLRDCVPTTIENDDDNDNRPSTSTVSRVNDRSRRNRRRTSSKAALEINLTTPRSPLDVTIDIFTQALNALQYIHSQDIVHHDIKPSNIFIDCEKTGDLYIQLGDFGLACPLQSKHAPDAMIGTPIYAAPEQMVGQCTTKVLDRSTILWTFWNDKLI